MGRIRMKTLVSLAACLVVGVLMAAGAYYALPLDHSFRYKRAVFSIGGMGLLLVGYGIWSVIDEGRGRR
jgi:hypothetical protein